MPIEWVVSGLVAVIGVLSTAVGILWRNHLGEDVRERQRADEAEDRLDKLMALFQRASRKSVGK